MSYKAAQRRRVRKTRDRAIVQKRLDGRIRAAGRVAVAIVNLAG